MSTVTETFSPAGLAVGTHPVPLVVDLDNTLLSTDLLVESAGALLAQRLTAVFLLVRWLLQGKARLKARIAELISIDPTTLPYNQMVLNRLRRARVDGAPLYLASASNERYVKAVADHLGIFDGWFGSDEKTNLSGSAKAERLKAVFGERAFDYVGDCDADLVVWKHARSKIAVNAARAVRRRLIALDPESEFISDETIAARRAKAYVRLLRPHQWVKNGLVVVPMLAAHALSAAHVVNIVTAFLAFSFCASSVYVLNDFLDIGADRGHPTKKLRPFAVGLIPPIRAVVLAPLLLAVAFALALTLPAKFGMILALYYVSTTAYSFALKRKMMIDVVVLAGLYTVRVLGGAAAVTVPVSEWLMAFCTFIFLSLALIKRHSEMAVRLDANLPNPSNRDYRATDLPVLIALSASAAYAAVIVCALYLASPGVPVLYKHPRWLYLMCPLLIFWLSRALMLSHRREMHDDPIVFALKDRTSLATVGLVALIAVAATL